MLAEPAAPAVSAALAVVLEGQGLQALAGKLVEEEILEPSDLEYVSARDLEQTLNLTLGAAGRLIAAAKAAMAVQ